MNDKYIFDLYIYLNSPQKGYDLKRFRKEISTDPEYNKRVYKYIGGKKAGIDYDAFAAATGLTDYLKRKKINSKKVINPMILITPLIKFMRQIMHMSKKVNQ